MYVCMFVCMCQHFQTSSRLKQLGPLKPNFMWSLHGIGGTKVCSNGPGHMTNMAAMPIYVETLKDLLQNQMADDLVCSIGCSSTIKYIQMMTWVDLDLSYGMVKFGPLCF